MVIVSADELKQLGVSIFKKVGTPDEIAQTVSDYMVKSHLYGHETHGVISVPRFVKDIRTGKINPKANIEIIKSTSSSALIDCHRGFGYFTAIKGMDVAIQIAKAQGVSAVGLTNCNHVGMLWGYVKQAVDKGMIGLMACSSGPQGGLVAPYGGTKRAIGANPMAFGLPSDEINPLIMDISTSIVAGGKVQLAEQKGEPIPEGWILDRHGRPSTDPREILDGIQGALLPFGRYKGYGLGLLIELLGGALTGYGCAYLPDYIEGNGTFMIVIDVVGFIPLEEFQRQADGLFKHVKSNPCNAETKEILIPGEIEFRTKEIREREGIPIPEKTWKIVTDVAEELGVEVPNVSTDSFTVVVPESLLIKQEGG